MLLRSSRFARRLLVSLALGALPLAAASAATADPARPAAWHEVLDRVRAAPDADALSADLVAQARRLVTDPRRPLARRQYRLEDIGKDRTYEELRAQKMPMPQREVFALAMNDQHLAGIVAQELPLLAAAWKLSGDEALRSRLLAQLEEMASWSPLQRSGWGMAGTAAPLPPTEGNTWLATGFGIRALADTLEMLPGDDQIPAALRARLHDLLRKEIATIVDDWKKQRPWFTHRDGNPRTNQWTIPVSGLVLACLTVGVDEQREAYEYGVAQLLRALDAGGPDGEFDEGFAYAGMTVNAALAAARAMAVRADDRRALDHPFLAAHPRWYVHHFMPARTVINAFNAMGASLAARDDKSYRSTLALHAFYTGSADAAWALHHLFDGPATDNLPGLALSARTPPPAEPAPALFAHYPRATRVNWRSSWADDATGLWVRGGHELEHHDHHDRGHVTFILRGRPVLIECGTPDYGRADLRTHFTSTAGHNVLELEGRETTKAPAEIVVSRMDADGGDIVVRAGAGYSRLDHWDRQLVWSADHLEVTDRVATRAPRTDRLRFLWHLVPVGEPRIEQNTPTSATVTWDGARLAITADAPFTVAAEPWPDRTLIPGKWQKEDHMHTRLVVTTTDKLSAAAFTTRIEPTPAP
jgi:hypothetical protein